MVIDLPLIGITSINKDMEKLIIKGAFVDHINMLQHSQKMLLEVFNKTKIIEVDLNSLSKEDLIIILNTSISYYFENSYIYYTINLTAEEKIKEEEDIKNGIKYDISRLKKWCEISEENKQQILNYLKVKNIVVEGLN
jgi:hypothetical protein